MAVVVLAQQNGKRASLATGTDTKRQLHHLFRAPGSYAVICLESGFVSDQGAGSVTISSNSIAHHQT